MTQISLLPILCSDISLEDLSPLKIEPYEFKENSTQEFSQLFEKRGKVIEYNVFRNNIIASVDYIKELSNLPTIIFNKRKAVENRALSYFYYDPNCLAGNYMFKRFSYFFNGDSLKKIIKSDASTFQYYINQYILRYGKCYKKDRIVIPDVLDFMIYVLSKNAYLRVFGSKLSKRSDVVRILNDVTAIEYQKNTQKLKIIELLGYLKFSKSATKMNLLSQIIETEISISRFSDINNQNTNLIQLLAENPEILKDTTSLSVTSGLAQTFKNMIVILPSRILSILIDISIDPDTLNVLSLEQTNVIEKYGKKFDVNVLKKMPILHRVVMKSLLASSPTNRKLNQNIVLSNGITLQKNSTVSINMFSNYHSETKNSNSVLKNQYYKNQNNNSNFRLLWGYGEHACPYSEYSLLQIKLVVSILLRSFDITSHFHQTQQPHPGTVSINMFSNYHLETKNSNNSNSALQNQYYKNKNNNSNFRLLWGYGEHACPYSEYSLLQIKLVVSILLRSFDITSHFHQTQQPHPGYIQLKSVVPKNTNIILIKKI
ncbi:hypothetical protein BB561_006675 [Smittium simulii]|uniref:Cytochrome P450 n=1 Tax=Smittium simulii TaxID=133385 RepID=A0A2T9Y2G0_9FUNG|nr:hypothetical protein BB561_006675 [Smittium simulii]